MVPKEVVKPRNYQLEGLRLHMKSKKNKLASFKGKAIKDLDETH